MRLQLQRHGARYPNLKEGEQYALAVERLRSAKEFKDKRLKFLKHYEYDLQADDLTPFGAAQCVSPPWSLLLRVSSLRTILGG